MPTDTSERPSEDPLDCQVCIIGSGAAGLTLARELGRHGVNTLVIAGGGRRETERDRALHRGSAVPQGSHEPLEWNRRRVYGGGTTAWGGRLVPFDAIDFEAREFVPLSGWPISYDEVAGYFPAATEICEAVEPTYQMEHDHVPKGIPDALADMITTVRCERWSTPTDFAKHYEEELKRTRHVRVLLDYHCVDIHLDSGLQRINAVRAVSRTQDDLSVRAELFVAAAGGIENARLLLASRSQIAAGIANSNDMVGRCYMGHVTGTFGSLCLQKEAHAAMYPLHRDRHGIYYRRRFWLTAQAQRDTRAMNIIGFPWRTEIEDPRHHDAVLSMVFLLRAAGQRSRGQSNPWSLLARHASNVVLSNPLAWISTAAQAWARARSPRLPFFLPYGCRGQDAFYFQAEHAPNPHSRILLGEERDEFGVPRVEAQVRFSEVDRHTVTTFFKMLDGALQSEGVGRLEYDAAGLVDYLTERTTHYDSMAHHLGTTRMSSDPSQSVVDANCRAHDVPNLYLCGGSVFPTSGHANPTLTILAITLRLAKHLATKVLSNAGEP